MFQFLHCLHILYTWQALRGHAEEKTKDKNSYEAKVMYVGDLETEEIPKHLGETQVSMNSSMDLHSRRIKIPEIGSPWPL